MKYTSAEAAKLLRKLNEEKNNLLSMEQLSSTFVVALEERAEDVRPAYDYHDTQNKLAELDEKIRRIKHALNCFNVSQEVPGFHMTIDQVLIYIPQLTAQKARLKEMSSRLQKQRHTDYRMKNNNIIEYDYANYDVEEARADLEKVSDELSRLQTALDVVNNTETLEIDL